jgi:HlyD family secretion protein
MFWPIVTTIFSLIGIFIAIKIAIFPPQPPNTCVMYTPPPANPYKQAVAASGLVEAYEDNVYLGAQVQGVVKGVYVKVGDTVAKEQLLLEVDDRVQAALVEVSKTNAEVAKATLEKNVSQLQRLTAVKDTRAVSLEDLRNKENDVKVAQKSVENALAQLHDSEQSLLQTKIYAPKDGVILRMDYRKGEFTDNIALNSQSVNNAPIVLGRSDKLQIRADIDEYNAFRIRSNQKAIAYTKGAAHVPLPLPFERFEPYCVPKRSLTAAADERVDTRVLQVIYTFDVVPDFPIYVGQQVDLFIDAPLLFQDKSSHEQARKYGIDLRN